MAADGAGSTLHAPELGAGKKLRQKALRVCVLCVCSVVQCGPTLCDPKDYSLPGSSVHGVFQARTLEWVCHFLLQGIFLTQGSSPRLLHWQVDSLPLCHLVTLCIFYRSWKKKTKRGFIMKKKNKVSIYAPNVLFSTCKWTSSCHFPSHSIYRKQEQKGLDQCLLAALPARG